LLKILQIIPSLSKGGAERLVLNICNELQNREDVIVKLVVLYPENQYQFLSKNIDIELCGSRVVLSITGKSRIESVKFDEIVSDFKPHIIHSHLFESEILSRWNLSLDIRYITHCHDNIRQFRRLEYKTLLNKKLLTNYYERNLIMRRYKACDNSFIAISKDVEYYLKKTLPKTLQKNISLLNNAIDLKRFECEKERIIPPKSGSVKLISIGSLTEIKNHLFLIEVLSLLNRNDPGKYHLSIIGDGPMRATIENKICNLQLNDKIDLLGLIDNVEDYLKKSDIYVYSCVSEGFGLTLIEAMAAGLPVICLDGKGNRDIIEEGRNGSMIFGQDSELFTNKIIELTKNKQLYSEMSRYAVNFAKKYDIKNYVNKLLKLYEDTLI
jgi:glycosyltransferase involved in cell wall biosynthesis